MVVKEYQYTEKPFLGQNRSTPYPLKEVLLRYLWAVIQATLFRWSPRCLHLWRVFLLHLFGAKISSPRTVRVYPSVVVIHPWKLSIAPRVMLGPEVMVYNLAEIYFEYGANISQRVHLCSGTHDYRYWQMPLIAKPIVIGENSWIAAEAFIGPGVTIGKLCVIGARSVVVKDQPDNMVCAGHPCKPLKERKMPSFQ